MTNPTILLKLLRIISIYKKGYTLTLNAFICFYDTTQTLAPINVIKVNLQNLPCWVNSITQQLFSGLDILLYSYPYNVIAFQGNYKQSTSKGTVFQGL